MENELAILEVSEEQAIAVYVGGGIDAELQKLRDMEKSFVPDLKTVKGRKEIASTARKVSTFKARLEEAGKALNSTKRAEIEKVDAERRKLKAGCDEIRDRIRKPLTDWEDAEKEREADEKLAAEIAEAEDQAHYAHSMWLREKELEAKEAKAESDRIESERVAAEKVEVERIRKEEVKRKEAEELRVKEATERAAKEATEAAERASTEAAEKAEREIKEARESAERARILKENAELEKKLAAERAVKEKDEAAELAIKEKADAEQKAREDEQRKQIEREEAERLETEKREANKKYVGAIRKAAKEDLMKLGMDETVARAVVMAINDGLVANVSIKY